MGEIRINNEVYSGSTNYASAIEYTKEDGTKSTVQNELDELNTNMSELNSNIDEQSKNLIASDNTKFRFATDGEGNYGYLKADDSFIPFKGKLKITQIATGVSGATGSCKKGDVIVIQWTSWLDVTPNPKYTGINITRSFVHEGGHGSDAGSGGACIGIATGTSVSVSYSIYGSHSMNRCYIWKITS